MSDQQLLDLLRTSDGGDRVISLVENSDITHERQCISEIRRKFGSKLNDTESLKALDTWYVEDIFTKSD
jgi:hypothetical protein